MSWIAVSKKQWERKLKISPAVAAKIDNERSKVFGDASKQSPILCFLEMLFFHLQFWSPAFLFAIPPPHAQEMFKKQQSLGQMAETLGLSMTTLDSKRAQRVDIYLLGWMLIEIFVLVSIKVAFGSSQMMPCVLALFVWALILWRLLDVVVTTVNQNLLNFFRYEKARNSSPLRNLVIVIANFFEVGAIFAILSAAPWLSWCEMGRSRYYQFMMNQFTIGGLSPANWGSKLGVLCQTTLGFMLTAIVIARLASTILPQRNQNASGE
jgi:hypothetical protein